MMHLIRKCLTEGRDFLYRHDLRNLRDVNILPASGQIDIAKRLIEPIEGTEIEKELMYDIFFAWQSYCNTQNKRVGEFLGYLGTTYRRLRSLSEQYYRPTDEYEHCYDEEGNLFFKGRKLRVETGSGCKPDSTSCIR